VVREYYGKGEVAELAAQVFAIDRAEREAERAAWRAEKAELEALDTGVRGLDELADLLARAALVAAGYSQHKRGSGGGSGGGRHDRGGVAREH
jgi:hypothetical protein